jgi:GntR family transcriptional regulator, transcriptional repressor for pyruvate dehydrogenase complex
MSVPDQVFERLRDEIVGGRYEPGARLPSQRALAAELAVNMATVREALGRLEQLRLVEVRHGEPMRVLDWRASGGLDALAGLRDGAALVDLFEARRLLLVEAARLAAERRDDPQADALAELAQAVAAAPDASAALLADWSFMATLLAAAGNIVFRLIMNSVRELYLPRAEAFAGMVGEREALAPLYARVAEAVGARDASGAAAAMEQLAAAQERGVTG